jgi:hypothetical protein
MKEKELNGKKYKLVEEQESKDGNINCNDCIGCHNSTWCDNSTGCDNSTKCYNSTRCDNSTECYNSTRCHNSTGCDNSTECYNSTRCYNCVNCVYCCDLTLQKYMIFNTKVSKEEYNQTLKKLIENFGYYTHPQKLTKENKKWLKENVKQYNAKILDKIIEDSILPDKPKEE